MVHEAVDYRGRNDVAAEDLAPGAKGLVAPSGAGIRQAGAVKMTTSPLSREDDRECLSGIEVNQTSRGRSNSTVFRDSS